MSKIYTAEFKCETARLVLEQNYTHQEAAKAMNVSLSAIRRWVKTLRLEREGKSAPGLPLTPEHIEFREMKKRIQRLEMENDILKKATALLIVNDHRKLIHFLAKPNQSKYRPRGKRALPRQLN